MKLNIAEKILLDLGITRPHDIDIDVIAWSQNVKVNRRPLAGCEARILGDMDCAVVSVNSNSILPKQRFSIAHELGHWQFDRGTTFICTQNDMDFNNSDFSEKQANQFAADLLLPNYLFYPDVRKVTRLNWDVVSALSKRYRTSLTATAIKFIDTNGFPAILAVYRNGKRAWFRRANQIPKRWFPRDFVDPPNSIQTGSRGEYPVRTDFWFDSEYFSECEISEDIISFPDGFMALLTIENEGMLDLDYTDD